MTSLYHPIRCPRIVLYVLASIISCCRHRAAAISFLSQAAEAWLTHFKTINVLLRSAKDGNSIGERYIIYFVRRILSRDNTSEDAHCRLRRFIWTFRRSRTCQSSAGISSILFNRPRYSRIVLPHKSEGGSLACPKQIKKIPCQFEI